MSRMTSQVTERQVLILILDYPQRARPLISRLDANDFGTDACRKAYKRYLYLLSQGKTPGSSVSFASDPGLDLEAKDALEVSEDTRSKVKHLGVPDMKDMLRTLRYYRRKRILHNTCLAVAEQLDSDREVDIGEAARALQTGATRVFDLDKSGSQVTLGKNATYSRQHVLQDFRPEKNDIIPTGQRQIDNRIGGFARTNLIAISAPRGGGKSVFAKTLALSHFYQKQNVYICNMEMGQQEYLCRIFAEEAPFLHENLRRGLPNLQDREKVAEALKVINDWGTTHNCRLTVDSIKDPHFTPEKLHQLLRNQGYDIVVVDYVNMFHGKSDQIWQNVYEASKYCKAMAKDLQCVLYLLTQLTDADEAKYSRALEEDADAWFLWRHVPGDPNVTIENKKGRSYDPFTTQYVWDRQRTLFVDRNDLGAKEYMRIERHAQDHAREVVLREQRMKRSKERLRNLVETGSLDGQRTETSRKHKMSHRRASS